MPFLYENSDKRCKGGVGGRIECYMDEQQVWRNKGWWIIWGRNWSRREEIDAIITSSREVVRDTEFLVGGDFGWSALLFLISSGSYFSSPQDHISRSTKQTIAFSWDATCAQVSNGWVESNWETSSLFLQHYNWNVWFENKISVPFHVHVHGYNWVRMLIWKYILVLMLNSYCCSGHQTLENRPDTSNAPSQTLMISLQWLSWKLTLHEVNTG